MKKTLSILAIIVSTMTTTSGQGTVQFRNSALSKIKYVETPNAAPVDAPTGMRVGIFYGPDPDNLTLAFPTATIGLAGTFDNGGVYALAGTTPGQSVFIKFAAWDGDVGDQWESARHYGESAVVQTTALGPTAGPGTVIFQGATGSNPNRAKPFDITPRDFDFGPIGGRAYVGTTFTFQVFARGTTTPVLYQWRKDGQDLQGQTNSSLVLTNLQFSDGGGYSVFTSDSLGASISRIARLSVVEHGTPDIRADGETLIQDVNRGSSSIVSISTTFPNGTIFYTTDGSMPTFASIPYQGSFAITQTTTIRAIAYSSDFTQAAADGPYSIRLGPTFALTKTVAGQGAVFVSPGRTSYPSGTIVTLVAVPDAGWRFVRWQGDACGPAWRATLTLDTNKAVSAVFEAMPSYLLITTAQGGTILGNNANPYREGSLVTLTAQPSAGWQFLRWEGDATGTSPNLTVTMDRAKNIRAVFGTSLTTTVGGSGSLVLQPPQGPYPHGSTVRVSPRPNAGSYFAVWGSAASGRSIPLDFVITNATPTISALFQPLAGSDANVYLTVQGEGTVSNSPNQQPYPAGTPVTLTALPAPGWRFVEWRGDATGTFTNTGLILNVSKTATAVFEALPRFPLAATTPGGGVILGQAGSPFAQGEVAQLTAQAAHGWQFLRWEGDASGSSPTLAMPMDRAKNVRALFGTGSIVPNAAGPGSITIDPPTGPYAYGSTVRLTATPNAGASFDGWGNAASGDQNPLNFVVNTANPAVCASFSTGHNGVRPIVTTQPASQVVPAGTTVTLAVIAGGTEPLNYQWHNRDGAIASATNATYTLNTVSTNAAGDYFVVVQNPHGAVTSQAATLTVFIPITFVRQPEQQVAPLRGTAQFTAQAIGSPAPSYQWTFDGEFLAGANSPSIIVTNVSTNSIGDFAVIAWNSYSVATSSVARLLLAPSLRSPFVGATLVWGKRATLSVAALGSGVLSYQWYKNGVAISGATSATLDFPAVQLNDAGLYSVVISSPWGSVTNAPAQLVVNPANINLEMYAGITIEGVPGYTYGIQSSTDLRNTNAWVTMTNYTLRSPVETWIDFESAGKAKRFYRVVAP